VVLSLAEKLKLNNKGKVGSPVKPIAAARAGRNRAPVKYQDSVSSSDEDSSSSDAGEFGSESEGGSESESEYSS